MYKIFMVEDDEIIARSIREHLQAWNYDVCCVEDFSNVVAEFVRFDPQLVLMDITLPFFNGYHWCSEIRKISKVPVIFLLYQNRLISKCSRLRSRQCCAAATILPEQAVC